MPQKMIRKKKYSISKILSLIGSDITEYDNILVNINSLRLHTFKEKGIVCVKCGLEASYFWMERHDIETANYHFGMYGINKKGKEVLFTKDHIEPKSKGGKNTLDNMQTMCHICNENKGNGDNKLEFEANDLSRKEIASICRIHKVRQGKGQNKCCDVIGLNNCLVHFHDREFIDNEIVLFLRSNTFLKRDTKFCEWYLKNNKVHVNLYTSKWVKIENNTIFSFGTAIDLIPELFAHNKKILKILSKSNKNKRIDVLKYISYAENLKNKNILTKLFSLFK